MSSPSEVYCNLGGERFDISCFLDEQAVQSTWGDVGGIDIFEDTSFLEDVRAQFAAECGVGIGREGTGKGGVYGTVHHGEGHGVETEWGLGGHDIIGFLLGSAQVLQDEWEGDAGVELCVKGSFFGGGGAPHVDGVGLSVWKLDLTVTVWAVKVRHHIVERTIIARFRVIKPDFDM